MKKRIGIWGQYSFGRRIADGQAVRTTIITNELIKRYGRDELYILDTEGWEKKPIWFFKECIKLFISCKKIVIFPADNGFKVIVRLYGILSLLFGRELYDVVIGGYLPGLLTKNPVYIKYLRKYKALFVQTPNLKIELNRIGLNNVHILSNLKNLETREEKSIIINNSISLKVCTLSRVTEAKGIIDAVEAVKMFNQMFGTDILKLVVYGIVSDDFNETFEKLLNENMDFLSYGGILDYDKTVEALKEYFCLLFPTYYYGEGFPGNVIDAYNSGLPIIATDWNYNKEIIKNGINGYLVKPHSPEEIVEKLKILYQNRDIALKMAKNNVREAMKYKPEIVLKEFYRYMDD